MRTERYSAVEDDAGEPEFMVAAAPGVWRPESGDDSVEQYIGEYFANEDDVWPQDLFSDMYRDDEANFPADIFHPRFDGLKLIFLRNMP